MRQIKGHGDISRLRPRHPPRPRAHHATPDDRTAEAYARRTRTFTPHPYEIGPAAREHRRSGKTSLKQRLMMASFAAAIGVVVFLFLTAGGQQTRQPIALAAELERVVILAGFGVEQVSISGHQHTDDSDIFDALDMASTRTFMSVDSDKARQRIEALPWVLTADLRRIYPGRIDVMVRERQPAAVWESDNQSVLIDKTGRVLAEIGTGSVPHLPKVRGETANETASRLFTVLERHPDVQRLLSVAERVGRRRWTLHLTDGSAILLPANEEARALRDFADSRDAQSYLAKGNMTFDLRARHRLTVRSRGAQADTRLPKIAEGLSPSRQRAIP